jgi:hypothetical protein
VLLVEEVSSEADTPSNKQQPPMIAKMKDWLSHERGWRAVVSSRASS